MKQPPRIPVRVVALLEREQRERGARLVTQRIAAQAGVAAEQQLLVEIELLADRAVHRREEFRLLGGTLVVARLGAQHGVAQAFALDATGRVGRDEQRAAGPEVPSVLCVTAEDERVAVGAERVGRESQARARAKAEQHVLRALDLVLVDALLEPVFDHVNADPRVRQRARLGQRSREWLVGNGFEPVPLVSCTRPPARDPAVGPARRPAPVELVVLLVLLELADALALRVARLDVNAVEEKRARRATRVERIERTLEAEGLRIAIVRVAVREPEPGPRGVEVRIAEVERQRFAVDIVLPAERELLAVAEQVLLFQFDAGRVLAALPAEVDARVQRPGVARANLEIHGVPVPGNGTDHRVVQVVVGAQDALRLLHDAVHVRLAGREQELVADPLPARVDVQLVRRAIYPAAFAGHARVEDVARDDLHLADHGARGFQLAAARHARRPRRARVDLADVFGDGHRRHQRSERHQQHPACPPLPRRSSRHQGSSTVDPSVRLASRSRWASATSRSA